MLAYKVLHLHENTTALKPYRRSLPRVPGDTPVQFTRPPRIHFHKVLANLGPLLGPNSRTIYGATVVPGGGGRGYERGTPVLIKLSFLYYTPLLPAQFAT